MQSGTKKVLAVTLTITATIFIGSYLYYENINNAEDPRIMPAKTLFLEYDKELESDEYVESLRMLDTMLDIYRNTPGYESSYEIGVLLNNKATVYLVELETTLLTKKDIDQAAMNKYLQSAEDYTRQAIDIYEKWLIDMGNLSEEQVKASIAPFFKVDDPAFAGMSLSKVVKKRVDSIVDAQIETPRRISVSLTNLGMINRYLGELEEARKNYEKAIALWDRNYTAQDNLNILLNQPVIKRSFLTRLFPPERVDDTN